MKFRRTKAVPLYVVNDSEDGWELSEAGDRRVICRFDRERDAIVVARRAAERAHDGRVVVRFLGSEHLLPVQRASEEELVEVGISDPRHL